MNPKSKRRLGYVLGLAFFTCLGLSAAPAGAQADQNGNVVRADGPVVPAPCDSCTNHDKQPGNGPGIFTSQHACDTSTGQGFGIYFFGNPNKSPVEAHFDSLSGTGKVEHHFDLIIPAGADVYRSGVPAVGIQVADTDRNQSIHLVGTIAGRPMNVTYSCPCLQPAPSTSVSTPPSSPTTPGSPGTPHKPGSPVVTSLTAHPVPAGTLPATGVGDTVAFVGVCVIGAGALLLILARRHQDV